MKFGLLFTLAALMSLNLKGADSAAMADALSNLMKSKPRFNNGPSLKMARELVAFNNAGLRMSKKKLNSAEKDLTGWRAIDNNSAAGKKVQEAEYDIAGYERGVWLSKQNVREAKRNRRTASAFVKELSKNSEVDVLLDKVETIGKEDDILAVILEDRKLRKDKSPFANESIDKILDNVWDLVRTRSIALSIVAQDTKRGANESDYLRRLSRVVETEATEADTATPAAN